MNIFNILAIVAFVVLLVFDSTLIQFKALGFLIIFLGYSVFRETQRVSFKLDELYEQISDLQEVLQKNDETGVEVIEEEK